MPGKALSERKKHYHWRKAKDQKLYNAAGLWRKELHEWKKQQARYPERAIPRPSLRKFAEEHGVDRSTLVRHLDDTRLTKTESSQQRQKLSADEEAVVVSAAISDARRGFPFTHDQVERIANEILQARTGADEHVGKNWVDRFLDRHEDEICTYWSRHLPSDRAGAVNPTNVHGWEDIVEREVVVPKIRPEDIYGMDETLMPPEFTQMRRVIAAKGKNIQYEQGGNSKETITVLVTICADGSALRPNVIFKAKRHAPEWYEDNVSDATITVSENGWTTQDIAVSYLEMFDMQTKDKADGRTRVLFLDGHSSHESFELAENAHKKNIKILAYPPHTTHVLQGLDVVCFAQLKKKHAEKIREFKKNTNLTLTHKFFLRTFGPAFLESFTPKTIKTAFSATGLYPFKRDVVSPEKMGPGEAISTDPPLPPTLATPVRTVLSAFSYYRSPTSAENQPAEGFSPLPTLTHDMTPTKRAKILYASLANSSSTSFLVSKAPVPASSMKIHEPIYENPPAALSELDFSADSGDEAEMSMEQIRDENRRLREKLKAARKHIRIRDQVIEAERAEMVVQNLTNRQLHASLFQRENNRKRKRQTLNFPSGQHVTSEDSRAELKRLKEEKEAKKREKEERAAVRATNREKKVIEGGKWDRAKARHEQRLRRWQRVCKTLEKGETRPPKPHRRLKAEVIGAESSSFEFSEGMSEDVTTEVPSSGSSEDSDGDSWGCSQVHSTGLT